MEAHHPLCCCVLHEARINTLFHSFLAFPSEHKRLTRLVALIHVVDASLNGFEPMVVVIFIYVVTVPSFVDGKRQWNQFAESAMVFQVNIFGYARHDWGIGSI